MYSRSLKLLPDCPLTDEARQRLVSSVTRALKYTHIYSAFTRALTLKLWLRKYGEQPDIRTQLTAALADFARRNRELEEWMHQHGAQHPSSFATLLNPHASLR